MNVKQISFSTPEGAGATLTIPEQATTTLIEALEQASAMVFRALKGDAPQEAARPSGEAEYASWAVNRAGEAEYASWVADRSGEAEYASWLSILRR